MRTDTTLTDLAVVFRSLKSELRLRPIYHHQAARVEGHLFITVIAYQLVQVIRMKLRQPGDRRSWRRVLEAHGRITTVLELADVRTIHIHQSSHAEREHRQIYDALGVSHTAGPALAADGLRPGCGTFLTSVIINFFFVSN